jgi:hypothetical protein
MQPSSSDADYEFEDRESALDKIENYHVRLETLQNKLQDAKTMAFQRWPSLREELGEASQTDGDHRGNTRSTRVHDSDPVMEEHGDEEGLQRRVSTTKKGYVQLWQSLKVRLTRVNFSDLLG